ncbi:MAG: hypothetical protein G3M70_00495 [Candidatus Nitronauta litoralis]|uniref:Uncharacterized protein n=1 Tax=Candidatus Nitronauta litoralis TaxID=2705533 RepID=A0A7T0BT45_9BACT|nr:MAG: hypothetical protein G3M70_00495 [Candidatus Nitronauta litoralis]
MPQYICSQCNKEYDTITADGFCTNQPECEFGTGWLREKGSAKSADDSGLTPLEFGNEAGLCILMMDGSFSMNEPAFPESDYPGTRYKLVAMNAAGGIWSLKSMTHRESAYLALAVFGGEPKLVSIKSVEDIFKEHDTPEALADSIQKTLENETPDARFTNINSAVQLAYEIKQAFIGGDLSGFGGPTDFKPVIHPVVRGSEEREEFIDIPNVRALIYTDGEHNVTSAIKNPFAGDEQSVLITAFIGEKDAKGVSQMQGLACTCPKHGPANGFFLIDSPERVQTLRGIFRMASGASGFCSACLHVEQKGLEITEPESDLEEAGESGAGPAETGVDSENPSDKEESIVDTPAPQSETSSSQGT